MTMRMELLPHKGRLKKTRVFNQERENSGAILSRLFVCLFLVLYYVFHSYIALHCKKKKGGGVANRKVRE